MATPGLGGEPQPYQDCPQHVPLVHADQPGLNRPFPHNPSALAPPGSQGGPQPHLRSHGFALLPDFPPSQIQRLCWVPSSQVCGLSSLSGSYWSLAVPQPHKQVAFPPPLWMPWHCGSFFLGPHQFCTHPAIPRPPPPFLVLSEEHTFIFSPGGTSTGAILVTPCRVLSCMRKGFSLPVHHCDVDLLYLAQGGCLMSSVAHNEQTGWALACSQPPRCCMACCSWPWEGHSL